MMWEKNGQGKWMPTQHCENGSNEQPEQDRRRRVLVTGASGLLGRPLVETLGSHWNVRGLCFSRTNDFLVQCDLTKDGEFEQQMAEFAPDVVCHLAAERRPDVVQNKRGEARALNSEATQRIAKACQQHGVWLLYISTDYVFDGTQPPYAVDATPNPLSEYGIQKLEGERSVMKESPTAAVLRIPLLFGPTEDLRESSVTSLVADLVIKKLTKADNLQFRYPTYTPDVAKIIERMLDIHMRGQQLHGIYHWQANQCLTKWDMVQAIAEITGLDASNVVADNVKPDFLRPEDSRLDCMRLEEEVFIEDGAFRTPFRQALRIIFGQSVDAAKNLGGAPLWPVVGDEVKTFARSSQRFVCAKVTSINNDAQTCDLEYMSIHGGAEHLHRKRSVSFKKLAHP